MAHLLLLLLLLLAVPAPARPTSMAPRVASTQYAFAAVVLLLASARAQLTPGGAVEDFFNTPEPTLPYYTPSLATALAAGCPSGCVMGVRAPAPCT